MLPLWGKGALSKDYWEWKYGNYNKFEEAEKAIDKDDKMVLC